MRRHYCVFRSPGTLFAETTCKLVTAWDPVEAVHLANEIHERHNATPYGFHFITMLERAPIIEEGAVFEAKPVEEARSAGMFFLGGKVLRYDEIPDDKHNHTLRWNMRNNDWPTVIEIVTKAGWSTVRPFGCDDTVVDPATGAVLVKGREYAEYRTRTRAAWAAE